MRFGVSLSALIVGMTTGAAPVWSQTSGEWDFSGFFESELRVFPNAVAFPAQTNIRVAPSFAVQPEVRYEIGDHRFTFIPFGRIDPYDLERRSHIDIREANWYYQQNEWDVTVGFGKVFWGVAESRHLIDIVNQNDQVEDIDGEDKLGQPMIQANWLQDWGTLSLFVLPGFRERNFVSEEARLRGALPVETDNPVYEADWGQKHVDFAARYSHSVGDWDFGLSHFYGTSREPRLVPFTRNDGTPALRPHYDIINQTSVDVQATKGAWLLKAEAIVRTGQGDPFFASVGGFEYTFFGAFDTNIDIGLLAEHQYDGRDEDDAPATISNNDVFGGMRLALNDEQDTELLAGLIIDVENRGMLVSVEAERRIGDSWSAALESRLFVDVPSDDLLAGTREDGFVGLRLTRFF